MKTKSNNDIIIKRYKNAKKNLNKWLDKVELAEVKRNFLREDKSKWRELLQSQKELEHCEKYVYKWISKVKYYQKNYPFKCNF